LGCVRGFLRVVGFSGGFWMCRAVDPGCGIKTRGSQMGGGVICRSRPVTAGVFLLESPVTENEKKFSKVQQQLLGGRARAISGWRCEILGSGVRSTIIWPDIAVCG
jgi:hypothetical protein